MSAMDDDVMAMISSLCGDDDMYFLPLIPGLNEFILATHLTVVYLGDIALETPAINQCAPHAPLDAANDIGEQSDDSFSSGQTNPRKRRCPGPSNPDAVLVDQATDEKLRQLNIDPNSREGKKERRRIRNRLSAQMHRERKQAYIETLQYEVELRDQRIVELQNQLSASMAECNNLKAVICSMRGGATTDFQSAQIPSSQSVPFAQSVRMPAHGYQVRPNHADDIVVRRLRSGTAVTSSEGSDTEGSIDASWADLHGGGSSPIDVEGASNTSSPSPSPAEPTNSRGRPTLSMFSIVLLLGISFFSGSLTSGPSYPLTLTAPYTLPQPDTSFLIAPDSRIVIDSPRAHTGGRVLLALPSDEEYASSLQQSDASVRRIDNSKAIGKWRPLQLSAPVHHWSSHPTQAFGEESSEREQVVVDDNSSPQIWKSQHHITNIFPAEQDTIDIKNDSETAPKKYLRARSSSPASRASLSSDITMYYDQPHPLFASARSKVLITEGRVLLDPALAARAAVLQQPVTASTTERGVIPSSWRHTAPPPPSSSASASSSSSSHSSSSSSSEEGEATLPANQLLTMLVPASAVQWGGAAWVDGDSPDNSDVVMEHLLRSMNLTDVIRRQNDGSDSVDLSSLWVEIGCTVLKARIVQDVSVIDGRENGI